MPILGLLLLLMSVCVTASATSAIPSIPTEGSVTAEQLDSAISAIEARDDLDEETRGQVVSLLRDTQAQIGNKASSEAAAAAFADGLETAPAETEKLRA